MEQNRLQVARLFSFLEGTWFLSPLYKRWVETGVFFLSVTCLDTYLYLVETNIFATVFVQVWCFFRCLHWQSLAFFHCLCLFVVHQAPSPTPHKIPTSKACTQPILHLHRRVASLLLAIILGFRTSMAIIAKEWPVRPKGPLQQQGMCYNQCIDAHN